MAGESLAWCAGGLGQHPPFCAGPPKGTGFAPKFVKAGQAETVCFGGCEHSKRGATCDGAHESLHGRARTIRESVALLRGSGVRQTEASG